MDKKRIPVINIGTSLESEEWLKIVYLKKKGYSHEEALSLVEKLASGEIRNIDHIPDKPVRSSERRDQKK